jgi:alpha-1,3-mannosyltransferase
MADEKPESPRPVSYVRQAKDIALGVHPWARFGPPLLLLADALLTSLIISKVACKSLLFPLFLNTQWANI